MFRFYTCFEYIPFFYSCQAPPIAALVLYCQGQVLITKVKSLLPSSSPYCQGQVLIAKVKLGLLPSSSSFYECCKFATVCRHLLHHCNLVPVPIWFAGSHCECNISLNIVASAAKHLPVGFPIVRCSIATRNNVVNLNPKPSGDAARPATITFRANRGFGGRGEFESLGHVNLRC